MIFEHSIELDENKAIFKVYTFRTWTHEQLKKLGDMLEVLEAKDVLKGLNWSWKMENRRRIKPTKVELAIYQYENGKSLEEIKEEVSRTTFHRIKKELGIT